MQKIGGDGIAMLEAHLDPEVFHVRLGKANDYAFREDCIGSLLSIRGPRAVLRLLRSMSRSRSVQTDISEPE